MSLFLFSDYDHYALASEELNLYCWNLIALKLKGDRLEDYHQLRYCCAHKLFLLH